MPGDLHGRACSGASTPSELPAVCASGPLQPRVVSVLRSYAKFPLVLRGVSLRKEIPAIPTELTKIILQFFSAFG